MKHFRVLTLEVRGEKRFVVDEFSKDGKKLCENPGTHYTVQGAVQSILDQMTMAAGSTCEAFEVFVGEHPRGIIT